MKKLEETIAVRKTNADKELSELVAQKQKQIDELQQQIESLKEEKIA